MTGIAVEKIDPFLIAEAVHVPVIICISDQSLFL
jgi:hypothetical protein